MAAAPDKRGVLVVELTAGAGCSVGRGWFARRDEGDIVDQVAAPGTIDLGAEFALHRLKLGGPLLGVGGDFKVAALATNGAGVGCEDFADDFAPGGREPRNAGFRAANTTKSLTEEAASAFHEGADNSTAHLQRKCFS
jgi:hypothetical protein